MARASSAQRCRAWLSEYLCLISSLVPITAALTSIAGVKKCKRHPTNDLKKLSKTKKLNSNINHRPTQRHAGNTRCVSVLLMCGAHSYAGTLNWHSVDKTFGTLHQQAVICPSCVCLWVGDLQVCSTQFVRGSCLQTAELGDTSMRICPYNHFYII